ncbi:uncharacterized protein LOC123313050 [Coccinella septempunctata]|uniref:uncharacterized protein LOC123313050 n=1 Tax=Coccinella septempunctata TaxID=41139 RepID=UPI001D07DC2B|nr:uncharacterized protein LOC123313050 [Coccinella septempunctata]
MANKVLKNCIYFSNLVGTRQLKYINKPMFSVSFVNKHSLNHSRNISGSLICYGSGARAETTSTTQGLSKLQAQELVLRLNQEERQMLLNALQEYQSKLVKEEYEGQLAASRWRSRFGRPSKLPTLGDVDPTGTYCPVPEDWLKKKCADAVPRPSTKNLIDIAIANSIPFVGFGFLDNFFMLLAGDYIDMYLGSYLCISTMAAAALGNTMSDILGIGSAFYVERIANRIGFSPPKLSPIQMDMPCSRNFANLGRVLGVTLGCLLGMMPLLFRRPKKEETTDDKKSTSSLLVDPQN